MVSKTTTTTKTTHIQSNTTQVYCNSIVSLTCMQQVSACTQAILRHVNTKTIQKSSILRVFCFYCIYLRKDFVLTSFRMVSTGRSMQHTCFGLYLGHPQACQYKDITKSSFVWFLFLLNLPLQGSTHVRVTTGLTFRHRASSIQDRRFAALQRTLFIYLINKYISLSDICLTVHHSYK